MLFQCRWLSIATCTSECVFPDLVLRDFSYAFPIVDEVAWRQNLGLYDEKDTVVYVVGMNFAGYSVFVLRVLQWLDVFVGDGCGQVVGQSGVVQLFGPSLGGRGSNSETVTPCICRAYRDLSFL